MTGGWIRLHRKIQETKLWESDEPYDMKSAWVDLLLMVNYEDQKFILNKRVITIKRGQTFTSIRKLSQRWHWGVKRTMAYLKLLEDLEMATVKATPEGTLITLVNYSVYPTPTTHNVISIRIIKKRRRAKYPPSETTTREKHKKMTFTPY